MNDYSQKLDEVLLSERTFGSTKWRDILKEHGRKAAELELMFEMASIEADNQRRERKRADDAQNFIVLAELGAYLALREKHEGSFEELKELDNEFMMQQEEQGRSVTTWLDEFGTNIYDEIDKLQKSEEFWIECQKWEAEKRRRISAAETEKRSKRLEEHKLKAVITAAANGDVAYKIIQGLIQAGVLRG